jgi:xanthine dehydrogenase YagT iron-sulfur-binding subunit
MSNKQAEGRSGQTPSRRDFLKGAAASSAATALLAPAPTPAAPDRGDVVGMGPGPFKMTLLVNGAKITTPPLEPRTTLLDALRNYLDVTGCKRVCDRDSCGACTVLLDGKPIYACTMLAVEAQNVPIRTAESLAGHGTLDPVPAAFVRRDAQQCGFCTPGFVVALRAVLDRNPNATPAEIEEGLSGNICRCGTYEQMRHAIADLCRQRMKGG